MFIFVLHPCTEWHLAWFAIRYQLVVTINTQKLHKMDHQTIMIREQLSE